MPQKIHQKTEAKYRVLFEIDNAIEKAVFASRVPGLEVGDQDSENLPGMKRTTLQSGMENLTVRRPA